MVKENVQKEKKNILIITANAAGGKPGEQRNSEVLGKELGCKGPDFICLQELVVCRRGGTTVKDNLSELCGVQELRRYTPFFLPTVDTERHPCPRIVPGTKKPGKWYNDKLSFYDKDYAAQGNGFLIRNDWEVIDLWEGKFPTPVPVQISEPTLFLGDRETEPRCLMLVRVKHCESGRELILGCVHLTVLREENEGASGSQVRQQQVGNILKIVNQLPEFIPIILAGDFNATSDSLELRLLSKKFECISQYCEDQKNGTHRRSKKFIDHIWFRPMECLEDIKCYLIDDKDLEYKTDEGVIEYATDHRPVVARLRLK